MRIIVCESESESERERERERERAAALRTSYFIYYIPKVYESMHADSLSLCDVGLGLWGRTQHSQHLDHIK